MIDGAAWIVVLVQILCVDLLLGADNAVVIALACSRLPEKEKRRAVILGAVGAIALRLGMLAFANALLHVPLVKLVAAWTLIVIALNVCARRGDDDRLATAGAVGAGDFVTAAAVITLADAAMSLDNVVALAAVSGGSFWLLAFGLVCTIPLIIFGSFGFVRLMKAFPLLVDAGAAMLGWVAGGMIVSDPVVAEWVRVQAPALTIAVPLACAVFVLVQGRFARQNAKAAEKAIAKCAPPPAPAAAPPKLPVAPMPKPVEPEPVAEPVVVRAAKPAVQEEAAPQKADDRWMVLGLAALFVIFGIFLTVVVMIPD